MKYLLCLVTAFSSSAFAAEVVVEKTPVYETVKCLEQSNVGRRDVKLSVDSVKEEDNKVVATFNVEFYNCMEVPGGYGFRSAKAEDAQMFLFRNDKVVVANKKLVYARFFRNIGDDFVTSDVEKNDNKYQVTFAFEKEEGKVSLALALNSTIYVGDEAVFENAFEYASPTYVTIK